MIKLKNIVLTAVICAVVPAAFAKNEFFSAPYFGVEAIQTNQNYKAGFGKDVFKKNTMNYNLFAGFKFYKFLGVEAGYEAQPSANKMVQLVAGQSFPGGDPITTGHTFFVNSIISGSHPYLGIFAEIDQSYKFWFDSVKYQFLFGASFSNIKTSFTALFYDEPNTAASYSAYSGSKVVPMAKFSITNNFTNNLGLRVSINYHNFAGINIQDAVKLKDTLGIGLGITYSFFKHSSPAC